MKIKVVSVRTAIAAVLLGLVIAACSGDSDQLAAPEIIDLREPVEDSASSQDADSDEGVSDDGASGDAEDAPIEIVEEPAQRLSNNPPIEATNWVARTAMDSTSVELIWSPVEGADTYVLYRLPTAEANYDAIATGLIEGAEEIYEGPEFGYIDDDVPEGTFLTYVLVAEVGDDRTEPRWTEALTLDDTEPPAPITGLVAADTAEGVLLEWEPSPDNVEFAAYNVSILEDNDRLRFIGGGADVGQVSFIDDEDFTGTRTYVVAAVDFHNNVSESAQVEVTR